MSTSPMRTSRPRSARGAGSRPTGAGSAREEAVAMKLFGQKLPEDVAKRVPPGQRLVKTWPVLHYGPIPTFDRTEWDLEITGLVDNPFRLTYDELKALGPKDV